MSNAQIIKDAIISMRSAAPHVDLMDKSMLVANLVFVHQVISATEDLMSTAIVKSKGKLREYLEAHAMEEQDHAAWLAADLYFADTDIKEQPLIKSAVSLAGSQYYMIKHVTPLALLGYMMALECVPMSLDAVEALEAVHGVEICRTMRFHAVHDIDHGSDLMEIVDEFYCDEIRMVAIDATYELIEFQRQLSCGQIVTL